MEYNCEVTINLPRERVVNLFDNTENLYRWMDGLQSFDHISGDPGMAGAKSRLVFKNGSRTIEMTETITKRHLPDDFRATYEASGVYNEVINHFYAEGDKTRWQATHVFKFNNLFMRIMGALMPGAFRKQTLKSMNDFKRFAEGAGA